MCVNTATRFLIMSSDLIATLKTLEASATQEISKSANLAELEACEVRFLGRKGELTQQLRGLASLDDDARRRAGQCANEVKQHLEHVVIQTRARLSEASVREQLLTEREDVTEPGKHPPEGHLHLVSHAIHEITEIFARAGFVRQRAPEVEWDWYVFEALNMPKDHPARDEQETFFLDAPASPRYGRMLLTTQATSGTARLLARKQLPLRAITISKTYRRQIDITHVPMFHQFDGVYVDKNVSIAHLRGIIEYFAQNFFGPKRKTRLRPYHFRFTEPSFEVDVSCGVCDGTGFVTDPPPYQGGARGGSVAQKCRTCKRGWLELGGAGLLHPNVLTAAGIDPRVYSGFAFGIGVERTYMMKEGMKLDDVRILYGNDLRFLQQF